MSNDKFLCNGTRFKLAFLDGAEDSGEPLSPVVMALNNFRHELDGRWVALVPAEDNCHLVDAGRVAASPAPVAQKADAPLGWADAGDLAALKNGPVATTIWRDAGFLADPQALYTTPQAPALTEAAQPQQSAPVLPELPKAAIRAFGDIKESFLRADHYTAAQMREYALAAIAARGVAK